MGNGCARDGQLLYRPRVAFGPAASAMTDPYTSVELWAGSAIMATAPLYFVLQAWTAYAWTGGWRRAAMLPLILMVPAILWSLYAFSDSSNLWPVPVILPAPFCVVYLLILCIVRALVACVVRPGG
jgi:hypothetical protein